MSLCVCMHSLCVCVCERERNREREREIDCQSAKDKGIHICGKKHDIIGMIYMSLNELMI